MDMIPLTNEKNVVPTFSSMVSGGTPFLAKRLFPRTPFPKNFNYKKLISLIQDIAEMKLHNILNNNILRLNKKFANSPG